MTDLLASFALGISASAALSLLVKATVILVLALLLVRALRTARASRRFIVLAWTFALLAVLPVAQRFGPAIPVVVHQTRNVLQTNLVAAPAITVTTAAPREPATAQPAALSPEPASGDGAAVVVAAMWATGVVISLLPVLMTLFRLRMMRRSAREWTGESPQPVHRARVLVHEQLSTPMTFGWRRPVILLPADADTWSKADAQRAFAHELEHVRRRDWPVHVLARIVCAFYWFHPLVWEAWRQLHLEADRACDDAVVSGSEAREFAEQLVALAERIGPRLTAPALSMTGGDLATRVNALLNPKQVRGRVGSRVAVAISTAAITLGAMVAAVQAVDVTIIKDASERPRTSVGDATVPPLRAFASATPQSPAAPVQQTSKPAPSPPPSGSSRTIPAVPQNPVAIVAPLPDYRIGTGDVLMIVFWRESQLTADVLVRPDGKISLSLINDVDAAGLTPEQLRDRLVEAYAKFLPNPTITVGVRTINSRKVFIVGGVQRPGAYDLSEGMTVLQLISVAGGLREFISGQSIIIIRPEDGKQTVFRFNYLDMKSGTNLGQNIALKPGDTVVVPE